MPPMVACIAHWFTSLMYVAPVGLIGGAIRWSSWREKRRPRVERAPLAAYAHAGPTA
jgi:hypothetical protein